MIQVSDEEALDHYSATYNDVVAACRGRYRNFLKNKKFNQQMILVKADPDCAHLRKLNPKSESSAEAFFYNLDATFAKLDTSYARNL